jgi:hypothetical protein
MSKSYKEYKGNLDIVITNKILLYTDYLENGTYHLKLMQKNKVIKEITFKKK